MAKEKITYVCDTCQSHYPKWLGQCPKCKAWNSLKTQNTPTTSHYAGGTPDTQTLHSIASTPFTQQIINTKINELNRVLGEGIVAGSVILLGGDPGIGKSTIMLQLSGNLFETHPVLYVSGEESPQQIAIRAKRLKLAHSHIEISTETKVEHIISQATQHKTQVLIVDSIQSIETLSNTGLPGSTGQLRESTLQLVRFAKQHNVAIWIIGHVTKEGHIAGPKILEHMVDVVLYFEDTANRKYRIIRAIKNRFGPIGELGIFAMTQNKLVPVENPSTIFLQGIKKDSIGNAVLVTAEGSRFLLIEVQALVDPTQSSNKRICLGTDTARLNMLLAILNKYTNLGATNGDIFVNVVGGIKITETAIDLPVILAIFSSIQNASLSITTASFGEIGLSGEVRPVSDGQQRIKEAIKHGFTNIVLPKANLSKTAYPKHITLHPVETVAQLIQIAQTLIKTT